MSAVRIAFVRSGQRRFGKTPPYRADFFRIPSLTSTKHAARDRWSHGKRTGLRHPPPYGAPPGYPFYGGPAIRDGVTATDAVKEFLASIDADGVDGVLVLPNYGVPISAWRSS